MRWREKYIVRGVAITVRLVLSSHLRTFMLGRVEISTPSNSYKRLLEGVELSRQGLSPYEGDLFHEMPFVLYLFASMESLFGPFLPVMIIFADVATGLFLGRAARGYISQLRRRETNEVKRKEWSLTLVSPDPDSVSSFVEMCYLLNPFVIVSCVAQTTSVLQNLLLGFVLWMAVYNKRILCLVALAFAAYQSLYPLILGIPIALKLSQNDEDKRSKSKMDELIEFWKVLGSFLFLWLLLIYFTFLVYGSWEFLNATYGFLVSVPDLTPNVGLFWYFFTEMFDHFRLFFLWVFQVNLIVYLTPVTLCLRDDPVLLYNEFLMLIAVFKSYPSVADAGLYLSLLPAWAHLLKFVRHGFVVSCAMICCAILSPVMWMLWIHAESANANFYFAITLAYSTAQIFLLTDLLYAHLRRHIHLKHGLEPSIDGKTAKIILQ